MKTEEQLIDPSPLQKLGDSLKETNAIVTEFKESTRKKKPKLLYNLTDIYKDAHAKLKINAETAKNIFRVCMKKALSRILVLHPDTYLPNKWNE